MVACLSVILCIDGLLLLAALAGDLPGGYLADRFGRRELLVASGLIFTTGLILYVARPVAWLIAVGAMLMGLGNGAGSSIDEIAMIEATGDDNRIESLTLVKTAQQSARVVAAVLGGCLAARFGMRFAILFFVPFLLLAAALILALPDTRPAHARRPPPFLPTAVRAANLVAANPRIRAALRNYLTVVVAVWVVWALQAPVLTSYHVSVVWLGIVYALFMLSPVAGMRLLGPLRARLGDRVALRTTAAGTALSAIAVAIAPGASLAAAAMVSAAFFGFSRGPVLFDAIYAELPDDIRGTAASVVSSVTAITAAAAYPLAGWGFEHYGRATLAIVGGIAGMGAVSALPSRVRGPVAAAAGETGDGSPGAGAPV